MVYLFRSFFNIKFMSVVRVRSLKKKYGDNEALKGISFSVKKGEILGFLGPNGAGKTTTVKILNCFMSANSGEASVAGYDCFKDSLDVRSKIGYLPENNPLYMDMTVFEYLEHVASLYDIPENKIPAKIEGVVDGCSLNQKIHSLIGTLSKGYRQRVGLAAALIHDPEILILDEPTVGLDPNQIVEIRNLIKRLGKEKTVIICSHNLAEMELTCTRVIIINQGKIVAAGSPVKLRKLVEGHANLKLTIRGNKKGAMKILQSINGIKNISTKPGVEKGAWNYNLITIKNRDLREEIVSKLHDNGFSLLEICKEFVSLEEIFNEVTK